MNNTFIKMLAAIEDPVAIERAYQMMAAKRDLLARNAEKTREFNLRYGDEKGFKHSTMEPRPLDAIACPDMVELKRLTTKVSEGYKLAPSLADIQFTKGMAGAFCLEIYNATPDMGESGFNNGDLFFMESVGHDRSMVRSVKDQSRKAIVHNRYLRVVFATPTGGRYRFPN